MTRLLVLGCSIMQFEQFQDISETWNYGRNFTFKISPQNSFTTWAQDEENVAVKFWISSSLVNDEIRCNLPTLTNFQDWCQTRSFLFMSTYFKDKKEELNFYFQRSFDWTSSFEEIAARIWMSWKKKREKERISKSLVSKWEFKCW